MPKVWWITSAPDGRQSGFSVVEVLLAAVVFGTLVTGLIGAVVYGRASSDSAADRAQAHFLAEEGIEATRNIGTAAYANLTAGNHGVAISAGQWAFSGVSDIDTSGLYTRQVNVAAAGTNRQAITSTVTWSQQGSTTGTVALASRLTNWAASLKLWTNAITAWSADATSTNDGLKVAVAGNYAFMVRATTTSNFIVANISNTAAPTIVFTGTVSNTPTNIAVSNGFVYITTNTAATGLLVYNVAAPSAPNLVNTVVFTGTAASQGVFVNGSYAYVVRAASSTVGSNEFNVLNVATPASAAVVGGYNNDIQMNEVYAAGNFAYVATSSTTQEMLTINVTNPTTPTLSNTYNPATTLTALTIGGYGTTVLLGMGTTLDALGITTPGTPAHQANFTAAGTINDIDVDITNKFAFLGTSSTTGEFQVVSLASLPASMSLTKTVDVTGTTSTVNGVGYASALDVVVGASAADTQEVLVFTRN